MVARASLGATAAVIALAGGLALGGAGPGAVAIALALAFLPYALLSWVEVPDAPTALRLSVGLAAVAGVVLVLAPSVLSDDLYRYLWDGHVSSQGVDPYLYAPDDPALYSLRDALYGRVNNPEIPTIYPPLAQLLFWVASAVDHAPWTLKALGLLAHLATILVVSRAAPPALAARATLLYGLNPLALSEAALGGHVDVVAGLALIAFALALARGRVGAAVIAAVVATGVKLVGLVLAPLIAARDRRAAALAVALSALVAAPILFAGSGSGAVAGVGHYARRWEGNAGLFAALAGTARLIVDDVAEDNYSAEGHVRLPALAPLVRVLAGGPLDPWATQIAEKKEAPNPTDFQRDYVASMLARGAALFAVLALVWWLVRRGAPPLMAARLTVFAVLLLSPQLHPWYLLWLLPLEAAAGGSAGFVFSATVLSAYAPLGAWLAERRWEVPPGTALLIHLPVLALLAWELRPSSLRSPAPAPSRLDLGKIQ